MNTQKIAGEVRAQLNPEPFLVGQKVRARFTNAGYVRTLVGKIVGVTKNYWKVEAILSPYENEKPGRVFHIATTRARTYSSNNRIVEVITTERETFINQWYLMALTTGEIQDIIGPIEGTREYGHFKTYERLPEAAKERLRVEYHKLVDGR